MFTMALVVGIASAAEATFTIDGVTYTYTAGTTEATITGLGTGSYDNLTLTSPVTYNGTEYTVTAISGTFPNSIQNLTITNIPKVTTGKTSGFSACFSKAVNVVIGDDVNIIDDKAFFGSKTLQSVTIGKDVTTIGIYCFGSTSSSGACTNMKLILPAH